MVEFYSIVCVNIHYNLMLMCLYIRQTVFVVHYYFALQAMILLESLLNLLDIMFSVLFHSIFIVCIVLLLLISHRYISTDIVYHFGCACGRSGIQLSFHSFLCSFHSNNCFANKEFKEQIHFQPDIITFNVLCNLTFHCSKRAPFNATMFVCTSCWH